MRVRGTKDEVRGRYGRFAARGGQREACGPQGPAVGGACGYAVGEGLYSDVEVARVPHGACDLSRGCGNPSGFADLRPGETVVDFGCGAGLDVILAAQKVGPGGHVTGIDFTHGMIERAGENVAAAGLGDRVDLRAKDVIHTGLVDGACDVVLSNCVLNLCPDKETVYREAWRILRPGGRLVVSDIVFTKPIGPEIEVRLRSTDHGCLAWAIPEPEHLDLVRRSGFTDVHVVSCHRLEHHEVEAVARCPGPEFSLSVDETDLAALQGTVASIEFTAVKP